MSETIAKLTEFETKYRVEPNQLNSYKSILRNAIGLKKFVYVEGSDFYYVNAEGGFARYRKPMYGTDLSRTEITFKVKPEGAKNNIKRHEVNWKVGETSREAIDAGLHLMGFKHNFTIWKECHIYVLEDATLAFYTVTDITENNGVKYESFCEIEVDEETIHNLTEEQAMAVIVKYEKLLEPLGLNPQRRLRKSLYEMYRRECDAK